MGRVMCRVELRIERAMDSKLMFGLNETIDQMAMANKMVLVWYVLRKDGGHVLARALQFKVKCQAKNGGQKRTHEKLD